MMHAARPGYNSGGRIRSAFADALKPLTRLRGIVLGLPQAYEQETSG